MLLQTNSYIVPDDKREEHERLMRRFRQVFARLGCDSFEVYEQVGSNWSPTKAGGRFIQMMRFRDRKHHQAVQTAERDDTAAQDLIREFCELINFTAQQEQGIFAMGHYSTSLSSIEGGTPPRPAASTPDSAAPRRVLTTPGPMPFPMSNDAGAAPAQDPPGNSKGTTHT